MSYVISGLVLKGRGYGRQIGFPTINLDVSGERLPSAGVYAGIAVLEGKEYRAGIVVGPGERIEAHLIGYAGDAYGKKATILISKFLREFKKFNTEEELITQIKKDLALC